MAAMMKTLFLVLMCLVAALAAFSSPVEAKGKVRTSFHNAKMKACMLWVRFVCATRCSVASRQYVHECLLVLAQRLR